MNTSGEVCQRRWLALRDRFGREVRKAKVPSGCEAEFYKQWHLMEAMQFLKPHIVESPPRVSLHSQSVLRVCQRRWLALRDRFGREVRKAKVPSGCEAEFYKQWHLMEAMQFLKPHIVESPPRVSLHSQSVLR
ncbi:uncharacterized protein [Bactrocera oleae]|uniref:uncharacterized protein n=1 Tax=Bactrocera oleae TaxID=104688 RepID=UPI00387E6F40